MGTVVLGRMLECRVEHYMMGHYMTELHKTCRTPCFGRLAWSMMNPSSMMRMTEMRMIHRTKNLDSSFCFQLARHLLP